MTGFRAAADHGQVTLTWRTANEAQLLGFQILCETDDGASRPVNDALLPAQHAGANQGATYAVTDAPAPGAYTYVLEAVQTDGQRVRAAAAPPRLFLPLVRRAGPSAHTCSASWHFALHITVTFTPI